MYISIEEFWWEGLFLLMKSRVFKKVYAVTSNSLALFGKRRFTKIHVWNKKKMAANDSGVRSEMSLLMKSLNLFRMLKNGGSV